MSLLDTASLIVTPNGYKEGKLYSVIPSDGSGDLSVTRATTATRVNSAGLVELVPYNLAQYSEQFDNAIWLKDAVTISANATTAPDATLTADLIYPQSSGNFKYIYQAYTQGDNVYTSSVYVKAQNKSKIWMYIESVGGYGICYFDLTNGTIQATTLIGSIESVGNGWYRCSVTTASSLSLVSGTGFGVCDALGSTYVAANGTDGVYIWGAQLVQGSVAKDYQKTETRLNIPRLDYSNGTCPSILVEPQRTNLCLWSNNLSVSPWINQTTNTTLTRIQTGGVDGGAFDRLVVGGAVGSYQGRYVQPASNVGANAVYSVYLKGSGQVSIQLYNGVSSPQIFVTLTNEWTRYSTVSTSGSGGYIDWNLFVFGGTTCDVAFHQLEFATYATSYIPTTSASVTRNADVISKTGISSLIGQTEGTLFLDFYYNGRSIDFIPIEIYGVGRATLYVASNKILYYEVSGTSVAIASLAPLTQGKYKIAFVYKQNDFALYLNGVLQGTFNSGNVPTMSAINISDLSVALGAYKQQIEVNATALWKTRLTNAQLATLTTI